MFRKAFVACFVFAAGIALAQDSVKKDAAPLAGSNDTPLQSLKTDLFAIKSLTFNKKVDPAGKGELLQVEFAVENNSDSPLDLYIVVLASIREKEWAWNVFQTKKLTIKDIRTRYFVPYPDDMKQYEYEESGKKQIRSFPKDFKTGVDPYSGAPYRVERYLPVRTKHLSVYRKRYEFFNHVTMYIFDKDGELLHYDHYSLDRKRR
jgi:hypothetical protein